MLEKGLSNPLKPIKPGEGDRPQHSVHTHPKKAMTDLKHWAIQPRDSGKFGTLGSESPSHKTPVSFKLPEDVMSQLKRIADNQGISVNLLIKDFVLANLNSILDMS